MTTVPAARLDAVTGVLKAIAHDVRLTLLHRLLEKGEASVGELEALTGIGQPGLSQQLAILRKAGLVRPRREAKLVFYSLVPESLQEAADLLCALSGLPAREGAQGAPSRARGSAAAFARIL